MVFNTLSVTAAIAPTVVKTSISHYTNRKPLKHKPTAHLPYHEGVNLIRGFLLHAADHTVEEVQAFTSQWVPTPTWVKSEEVNISAVAMSKASDALKNQLGHMGIDRVGGSEWWKWRREGEVLRAEWIEMRSNYEQRQKTREPCKRVMLYVHGGAYFFGSVDEHRYQLQRHARKLEARVFAPRYRLAPQFPFPCGLYDCLAAYIYLLSVQDASTIVLSGDSAGAGMILSILVILRDQGLPLPAGAVLISPWVDLTHSFPSVSGDNSQDYIPSHGFLARPSRAWPPPNEDDMEQMAMHAVEKAVGESMPRKSTRRERQEAGEAAAEGIITDHDPKNLDPEANKDNPAGPDTPNDRPGNLNTIPGPGHNLSIMLDNKMIHIKDQIQMYTTNPLISHPLVSPILQPSLGGLPPLLVLTGGGEVLRDEQIYVAHKAANPSKYPPGDAYLSEDPTARETIHRYKPTDVQLQVWDDLCHVAPTLSFTRPAKYMYRSIAQFSAWALACAQNTSIEIPDDDSLSQASSSSSSSSTSTTPSPSSTKPFSSTHFHSKAKDPSSLQQIGKAGDPLPPFKNHMIRQSVSRHGTISPLPHASHLPACTLPPSSIGIIKPIPVRRWLDAKTRQDTKFAKEKRKVQEQRAKEMVKGYSDLAEGDVPPPSALAGRRGVLGKGGEEGDGREGKKRSWGMSLWGRWGSRHDERRVRKADEEGEEKIVVVPEGEGLDRVDDGAKNGKRKSESRSRSGIRRTRQVSNLHQRNGEINDAKIGHHPSEQQQPPPIIPPTPTICPPSPASPNSPPTASFLPPTAEANTSPSSSPPPPPPPPPPTTDTNNSTRTATTTTVHTSTNRPYENGIAYRFKLSTKNPSSSSSSSSPQRDINPSTITLHSTHEHQDSDSNSDSRSVANKYPYPSPALPPSSLFPASSPTHQQASPSTKTPATAAAVVHHEKMSFPHQEEQSPAKGKGEEGKGKGKGKGGGEGEGEQERPMLERFETAQSR